MTGWLEYFVEGLSAQLREVRERGEQAVRCDVLIQRHGLNERQGKALRLLLQQGKLSVQDFEAACPGVSRRSLQRDLKNLIDRRIIAEVGAGVTDPSRHYIPARCDKL
jgi:predicted HTH transcriptional regulator